MVLLLCLWLAPIFLCQHNKTTQVSPNMHVCTIQARYVSFHTHIQTVSHDLHKVCRVLERYACSMHAVQQCGHQASLMYIMSYCNDQCNVCMQVGQSCLDWLGSSSGCCWVTKPGYPDLWLWPHLLDCQQSLHRHSLQVKHVQPASLILSPHAPVCTCMHVCICMHVRSCRSIFISFLTCDCVGMQASSS